MKRLYTYIFIAFLAIFACLSCVKEPLSLNTNGEAITELLEVPEEVVFDSNQGVQSVTILTRYDYSASAKVDWITCLKLDHKTLRLEVEENKNLEERTAIVEVTITDERFGVSHSKSFQVRQTEGDRSVEVYTDNVNKEGKTVEVSSSGGSSSFYLCSNIDYKIKTEVDWIDLSTNSGRGEPGKEVKIGFSYGANNVQSDRVANIGVYDTSDILMATITVTQKAFKVAWEVPKESMTIEPYDTVVNKISIYTNLSWTATCEADWITLINPSYDFTGNPHNSLSYRWTDLEFTAELCYNQRSATIEITNSLGTKSVVTVTQYAVPQLEICYKKDYSVRYLSEEHSIEIFSQFDWVATSSNPEWLTITTSEGEGAMVNQELSFKVADNFSNLERKATITLAPKDALNATDVESATLNVVQDRQNTLYYTGGIFYEDAGTTFDATITDHCVIDEDTYRKKLVFGGVVTSIYADAYGKNAWGNGTTDITLPGAITHIGDKAFRNAYKLTSIYIPATIEGLGEAVFQSCYNLKSVTIKATEPPVGSADMFQWCSSIFSIYVPSASVEKYKTAEYWSEYADHIKDGGF